MEFIKEHLCQLPYCYAVSAMEIEGRLKYLFATDDTGPCYSIDAETGDKDTVWKEPGGTMSIVPLAGQNAFLASQKFLPGFAARSARIVRADFEDGQWQVSPWMELPYVHRFDLLRRNGVCWFLGCILTTTDKPKADWSYPGQLVVAEIDEEFSAPKNLMVIAEGMTHNHGYLRMQREGYDEAYTACDEGIFRVVPPETREGEWTVEKILDKAASDIALCDIDGDGEEELAAIEPFHGNQFVVYKKYGTEYKELYRYPEPMEFIHVVWGGKLGGKPVFLGGCRAINKEFFVLSWEDGKMQMQKIETDHGPSNVFVLRMPHEDRILTANRESAESAVFTVKK